MELCPYCGEDVPGDSQHCWKCGADLTGAAPAGPPGEVVEERPSVTECPRCEAPVHPRAERCAECGLMFRAGGRTWRPAAYVAFALVCMGLLLGLVYAGATRRHDALDPGRSRPLGFDYEGLARLYEDAEATGRLAELWQQELQGRFVEWEMTVVETRDDGSVALAARGGDGSGAPAVVLSLRDPADLDAEEKVSFSGALDRYEGRTFYLSRGVVLPP